MTIAPFAEVGRGSPKLPRVSQEPLPKGKIVQILEEGQTVRHQQYGVGTVTESNSNRTTIDFDNYGMKKFVTSIWSAELVGELADDRPARRRRRRKTVKK